MISDCDAHSCCWVIKHKNRKQEPIPAKIIKISRNSGESKDCGDNQKTTCYPLNPSKRNIFEHDDHDLNDDL